jgi:hypothetical protein
MRSSRTLLIASTALVIGAALGAAVDHKLRPDEWRIYPERRAPFVVNLASQFGDADAVAFGDSLTEQTVFDGACGHTFNAGVGGAFVEDIRTIAPAVMRAVRPETVILSLGTNYVVAGGPGLDRFPTEYAALARSFAGRRLILVGLRASPAGDGIIRDTARQLHARYVPAVDGPGLIGPDGVHHTPAGSRAYRAAIAQACATPS